MTRQELYLKMNDVVRLATGISATMIAQDSHPSPSGTYCSIEPFNGISERGHATQIIKSAANPQNVTVDVKPQYVAEVSFNFYREGASRLASKLMQANKRPDVSALLYSESIGWQRTTAVRNLTGRLADGSNEERAQISVYVMFETSDPIEYNAINEIPYTVDQVRTFQIYENDFSMGAGFTMGDDSTFNKSGKYVTYTEIDALASGAVV